MESLLYSTIPNVRKLFFSELDTWDDMFPLTGVNERIVTAVKP
ncbi:MAG: hypothetical protein ACK56W_25780 [Pirellula sp.]|jgi:hypothetical protein